MITITLTRLESSDDGTFGKISSLAFEFYTAELPDRGNMAGKSCIPKGTYKCSWRKSEKHGECYGLENVPGRTDIEIHKGNFAGDRDKNLKCDVLGCILLGNAIGELGGQKALMASGDAIQRFNAALEKQTFLLVIK